MDLQSSQNEAARLQALREYQILDTDAEAEFDDFTLLAAQICGTPISLISLVDADRQWFKSNVGLEATETPREQAFCAHALHQPNIFLVPDAAEDARFSENPLVTGGPNIRFYAGAPLLTPEGQALGTLCVIDRVPRTLTAAQQAALEALSRQVVARLELRRQLAERVRMERARAKSEALKHAIFQSSLDSIITINQQGCVVEWNPAAVQTFGYSAEEAKTKDLADLIVPPRYHEAHRRGMAHFFETGEGPVLHQRVEIEAKRADGTEFPVELAITPIVLENETLFTAYLRDISDRKHAEAALRSAHEELETRVAQRTEALAQMQRQNALLLESAGEGIYGLDVQGMTKFVNPAGAKMLGYGVSELIGKPMHALLHHTHADGRAYPQQDCPIYRCLHDGETRQADDEVFWRKDGIAFDVEYIATPTSENGRIVGAVVTFQDISERKRSEAALLESETRYRGLVEHSPEAVVVYSENQLVYVNAAAVRLFGASCAEDMIGRRIFDFVHPDFHALSRARAAHSLGEGQHSPLAQQKYVRLDGRVIDVEVVSTSISYKGKPAGQVLIRDITERKRAEESILALNAELLHAYDATIEGWSRALDLRDHETEGHSRRVTEMTLRLARAVGIPEAEMVHVRRGALLHDIGKMGVPDAVLLKPGPLDDDEWVTMRRHPALAREMLDPAEFLRPALTIPYCHHEKWDGSGYPQGLRGDEIPLSARLFALVDVWDALSSDRPYRAAWPPERIKDHLHGLAGTHFDPNLVTIFLGLLDGDPTEMHELSRAA